MALYTEITTDWLLELYGMLRNKPRLLLPYPLCYHFSLKHGFLFDQFYFGEHPVAQVLLLGLWSGMGSKVSLLLLFRGPCKFGGQTTDSSMHSVHLAISAALHRMF